MYHHAKSTVFLDGNWLPAEQAQASLYNQTMHYGSGAFEGIRAYRTDEGTRIFKAEEHYQRLIQSAQTMGLQVNYSVEELVELSYQLLSRNHLENAYLRPLVYSAPQMKLLPAPTAHVFLCAWEWGHYLGQNLLQTGFSSYRRLHPQSVPIEAKITGHYTNSILASNEAAQNGWDECLMLDTEGYVAEAPGANLFLEKDEVLFTPARGHIFPGITRSTVIDLAHELGLTVIEKRLHPEDLLTADRAFLTGTAAEVVGIASVGEYTYSAEWEDSVGYLLQKQYQACVRDKQYQSFALV